jgi:hypothetical protein
MHYFCRQLETYGVGEDFYGLIGNVPRAGEYFGWTWDSDCRSDGGPGGAGCDYGAQYEQWMSEQGYDTSSDAYLAPGAIAAFFSHRELISPKSATKFRNSHGSSNGGVRLPEVTGKCLKRSHGNAGKIPGQIARQVQGEPRTSASSAKPFGRRSLQIRLSPRSSGRVTKRI